MQKSVSLDDWQDYIPVSARNRRWYYDAPLQIWDKKFNSDPESFIDFSRRISDRLLFSGCSIFDKDYPNSPDLSAVVAGKLNPGAYMEMDYAYGAESFMPKRDNHFYEPSKNYMMGEITGQPFKFTTKSIDNEFSRQMRREASIRTAKAVMNVAYGAMEEQGIAAAAGAQYKGVNVKADSQRVLSQLNPQQQLEYLVWAILQDANYKHNFLAIGAKCFDNRYDIRKSFAAVEIEYGELVGKHLPPAQVNWLANKPVETFEDPAVGAVGYRNYLTMEDALVKYGAALYRAHGITSLKGAVQTLREGKEIKYNPMQRMFGRKYDNSGLGYRSIEQLNTNFGPEGRVVAQEIGWDNGSNGDVVAQDWAGMFYPAIKRENGYSAGILEHVFYFKMVEMRRFMLKIDGRPVTAKTFREKLKGDWERKYDVDVEIVPTDYKAAPGEHTVELPVARMYQGKRLGHSVMMDVGIYEYAPQTNGRSMGWPVVASLSQKKSFAALGEHFCRRVNVLYQRVDEIIAQTGHLNAILVDEAQETDYVGFLYNAKRTGIARYNSTRSQGGNAMAQRHLSSVTVGQDSGELERLLQLIGLFITLFENMVGTSPQVQGVHQKYSGLQQTQMNVNNQSMLKTMQYWEHTDFMNQFLQRFADVAVKFYADDEERTFMVDKKEQVVLKSLKEMALAQISVHLESGTDLAKKKEKIEQAASQVLSSAGIEFLEPLIDIYLQDNAEAARSLLRENVALLKQVEKTNEERAAAAQQAQNEAIMAQTQMQMDLQKEKSRSAAQVQILKNQAQSERNDFEGTINDIDSVNKREEALMADAVSATQQSAQ